MQYIYILWLIGVLSSCKAQNITPIFNNGAPEKNPSNYYKDVDNDFNKFEGTWKYQVGIVEFTIKLKKEEAINDNDGSYIYDLLVGEYEYRENNVVIANTLDDFDDPNIVGYEHHMGGISILDKFDRPKCDDCTLLERRSTLLINSPNNSKASAWLFLRYVNDNGVEKIEVALMEIPGSFLDGENPPHMDMPSGYYTFIKQP